MPMGAAPAVHAAHQPQPQHTAPLQKAIPVKQAVAVSPAPAQQPHLAQQPQPHLAHQSMPTQGAAAGAPQYSAGPSPHAGQSPTVYSTVAVPAAGTVAPASAAPVRQGMPAQQSGLVRQSRPVEPASAPPPARLRRIATSSLARHPSDGLAIVGLGLGLVGLPLGLAPYYGFVVSGFGAALGVAAILAAIGLRKPGGMAVAALSISGIGLCFQVSMWNLYWRERPEHDDGNRPSAAVAPPAGTPSAASSPGGANAPDETSGATEPSGASGGSGTKPTTAARSVATPLSTPAGTAPSPVASAGKAATSAASYEPWQELRVWTIADKPVLARLKVWNNARAILELADGETLNTSQSALSEADRRWVESMLGK